MWIFILIGDGMVLPMDILGKQKALFGSLTIIQNYLGYLLLDKHIIKSIKKTIYMKKNLALMLLLALILSCSSNTLDNVHAILCHKNKQKEVNIPACSTQNESDYHYHHAWRYTFAVPSKFGFLTTISSIFCVP